MADTPRRRADSHFTASEARDAMVRSETEKERAAFDIRTAKLKALRLEKEKMEADEKAHMNTIKAAAKAAGAAGKKPAKPRKKPAAKTV